MFPINPEAGYIDGSVYLFDVHNMIYTTEISFGTIQNQQISLKTTLQIDFAYEGTGFAETDFIPLETTLTISDLLIEADMLKPNKKNLGTAKAFVNQFIETWKIWKHHEKLNGRNFLITK